MTTATTLFSEAILAQQKQFDSISFPAILTPNCDPKPTLDIVTSAIKSSEKPYLESLLLKSGAILFRGFPLTSPSHFNDFVESFGYQELPYVGGAAPRTNVVGRVFTANESPPDQKIPFHHEMAQVPEFPSKLFFFCEVEPGSGGETPIVLSHVVYQKMKDKYPEFVQRLEEQGLMYTRVLGEEDNPNSPIGRGWKSTFLTTDKAVAQERAARLGMKLEWLEDGGVKTIMGPIAGVKRDKRRSNREIWFNSMVAAYTGWEDERNDPKKAVTFGDGKPLPSDIVYDCLNILEQSSVVIPWKAGDVLLIDNWAVLHARKSFHPPRRVLASLVK
ncbi:Clavaminate synthase-like protein At3g21360 [Linum grandiflorum]